MPAPRCEMHATQVTTENDASQHGCMAANRNMGFAWTGRCLLTCSSLMSLLKCSVAVNHTAAPPMLLNSASVVVQSSCAGRPQREGVIHTISCRPGRRRVLGGNVEVHSDIQGQVLRSVAAVCSAQRKGGPSRCKITTVLGMLARLRFAQSGEANNIRDSKREAGQKPT